MLAMKHAVLAVLFGAVSAAADVQGPNMCPVIAPLLPSECTANADCSGIKCVLNWDNEFVFDALVSLNPCAAAASVGVELDLQQPVSDSWSHTWSLDEDEKFAVPGASVGIAEVDVGLYAEGSVAISAGSAKVTLAFDLCGELFGYEECGADLTYYVPSMKEYVPFVVVNHTFALSDLCGGGMAAPAPRTSLRAATVPASATTQYATIFQDLVAANGDGCCGDSCTSTAQCAEGMFCCPNHNMCMDVTTKGTIGPACDKCRRV